MLFERKKDTVHVLCAVSFFIYYFALLRIAKKRSHSQLFQPEQLLFISYFPII